MIQPSYCQRMARYNRWQNTSLITAADTLSDDDRRKDRGAFFKSINDTFNHILWADRIWMSRLGGWDKPDGGIGDSTGAGRDWAAYKTERDAADRRIIDWADALAPSDLEGDLSWYSGAMKADLVRPLWVCTVQLFNHQTHHRGQIHAMLTAAGAKPEDTDLPFMPEEWLA